MLGAAIGTDVAIAMARIAIALGIVPEVAYGFWDPVLILPLVGVVLTTWLASWVGSRRVLSVTPLQALGGSEELSREEAVRRPGRNAFALVLTIIGFGFLALGIVVGLANPIGVLVGLVGGILSFTGIVFAADRGHAARAAPGRPDAGRPPPHASPPRTRSAIRSGAPARRSAW